MSQAGICPVFGLVLVERLTQRRYLACAIKLDTGGKSIVQWLTIHLVTTVFMVLSSLNLLINEYDKATACHKSVVKMKVVDCKC
ncbi:hypothetical protein [Legionella israelensis]|uniref:hypothetical protein n=1 Tax=Legionella israelensis TaxID=454 RepID=UPI00072FA744|nr:hypothetical protein [Legionella israelensis]